MAYDLTDKRVFVTGATGFLGRHLAPALVERAGRVDALIRTPAKAEARLPDDVQWHEGDLTEPSGWPSAIADADVIVHVANLLQGDEDLVRAVNVDGTRRLALRAADHGVDRFLYVSSVMVYGFSAPPVVTEETAYGSDQDAYGRSKKAAEALLLEMHTAGVLSPIIVEPSAIYGPHDRTWTLTPFELTRDGWAVLPDEGSGVVQPIYVDDAVEGVLRAITRGTPGERYILSGTEPVTLRDYFGRYDEMVGGDGVRTLPGWLLRGAARLLETTASLTGFDPPLTANEIRYLDRHSEYSHAKAARKLGFEPRYDLDAGIERVRRWLREEGLLERPGS